MDISLYVFSSGAHQTQRADLQQGATGAVTIPIGFFLVRHPRGNVLFDTGNNDRIIDDPGYWGQLADRFQPVRTPDVAIDSQLAQVGITPDDIDYVVLSHFHLDHVGNVGKFLNSTFVYQLDEIHAAHWAPPGFATGYLHSDFAVLHSDIGAPDANAVDVIELDGDHDLFGDGTVVVRRAVSHTPGSQMLVVDLPNTGPAILPGDAVYLRENLENNLLPPAACAYSPEGMLRNYAWIRNAQRTQDATVFYSHDPDEFVNYLKPPKYYD